MLFFEKQVQDFHVTVQNAVHQSVVEDQSVWTSLALESVLQGLFHRCRPDSVCARFLLSLAGVAMNFIETRGLVVAASCRIFRTCPFFSGSLMVCSG